MIYNDDFANEVIFIQFLYEWFVYWTNGIKINPLLKDSKNSENDWCITI